MSAVLAVVYGALLALFSGCTEVNLVRVRVLTRLSILEEVVLPYLLLIIASTRRGRISLYDAIRTTSERQDWTCLIASPIEIREMLQ